jgi:N-hydroxyarylamine O-acetyltransferase
VPLADAEGAGATHWMTRDGDLWTLRMLRDGRPVSGWVTTLEQENPVDFEVANHYIATHPDSLFVNRIMLSAATPEGRVSIMNRDVTILRGDEARSVQLADRADLRVLLAEHFGFDVPEVEHLKVPAIPEWQ